MEDRFAGAHRAGWGVVRLARMLTLAIAALGIFATSASAWGGGGQGSSSFTIVKEQRLSGGSYTKNELTGKIGEKVEYQIVVTNTGSVPMSLSEFSDPGCDSGTISGGPGSKQLQSGEHTTYTCSHVLAATGVYTNTAWVTGTGNSCFPSTLSSNTVQVNVPQEPALSIVKEQKIGTSGSYTTSKLVGQLEQTVYYRITVSNVGNVTLKISRLTDENCTNLKLEASSQLELASGQKAIYTCEHHLTAVGKWVNEAEVETCSCNKIVEKSNKVEVEVPAEERFEVSKSQRLNSGEYTTNKLVGQLDETVHYQIVVTNRGNTTLAFELSGLKDPNCTNAAGPQPSEIAPGHSTTYTCEHKLTATGIWPNEATVESRNHLTAKSNKVEVEVKEEPALTIVKEQKFALEPSSKFTTEKLIGQIGQIVDYRITVANVGNVPLQILKFVDEYCSNPVGPYQPKLVPGEAPAVYTCEHELTSVGTWVNAAEVEAQTCSCGKRIVEKSNKVEVEVPPKEEFTVSKEQKLAGESTYTRGKISARLKETVDYQITVTNTGTATLTLKAIKDPNCTEMSAPSRSVLAPKQEATYTCLHVLESVGTWVNEAEIETITGRREHSNKVEVEVPAHEEFTVKKEQKLGATGTWTTSKLTGQVGETVYYQIVVTDTGNTSITLKGISDSYCTNMSAPSKVDLAPGESATYTCEHKLEAPGVWTNVATVETPNRSEKSNTVEVEAPAPKQAVKPVCELHEASIVLHGVSGSHRQPFTVRIPSLGIKQITFYIDGHVLKTLKASQARNGEYSVTVTPARLGYGAHRISVKTAMKDSVCKPIAEAATFVHPRPSKVTPKFTG